MKRFIISKNDTVRATAESIGNINNRLLCSVYNSNFTRISEVISALNRKIPHYSGKKIEYFISIPEKAISKRIIRKVNQ